MSNIWNSEEKKKIISTIKKSLTLSKDETGITWSLLQTRCSAASILLDFGSDEGVSACVEQIQASESFEKTTKSLTSKLNPLSSSISGKYDIFKDYDPSSTEIELLESIQLQSGNHRILNSILVHLSRHPDIKIRRAAILSLANSPFLGNYNTSLMVDSLKDPDAAIRSFAAYYISQNSSTLLSQNNKNSQILKSVIDGLSDSDKRVRKFSVMALWNVELPEVQSLILNLLKDPESSVRAEAAMALRYNKNARSTHDLIVTARDSNPNVRRAAITSLNVVGKIDGTSQLINSDSNELITSENIHALQDSDYGVRQLALIYVVSPTINDRRIVPALISSLKSINVSKDLPVEDWTERRIGDLNNPILNTAYGAFIVTSKSNISLNRQSLRQDALSILETLFDSGLLHDTDKKAAIPALMAIYKNWDQPDHMPQRAGVVRFIRKLNESEKIDRTAQQRTQQLFYLETGILGAIGVTAIGLLLSSIRLRNPFSLFFSTYLLFPEEVVAELIALKQRRQSENVKLWKIRLELAYEILILIWAFQIQIRIDDLKLPPGGNRSAK